ncbi:type I-E CRISPR-associated protein Cse1/CasA [Streptococcus pantholopis]|uniref:Type I-E CRISPR-associated protein Cse1/CasA n=1 Tax=Streptococcus pantholopis TaxID=1811193 RepID=A0A172QAF9_9STRE|nr:type I-E CRISPR-associated protein Cse1/CasA [Streptococcus pantholopis]AND80446.1 type I-E CRISPR-associated protein Cse1/CasA [Streptococcus pantholopis]
MSRFNLLDEPWISVVYDERGHTKEVSFLELFAHAHQYKDLAGDTKTQDFAVLRVLLAVLHTVFSRFDADGNPYDCLEVDERLRQIEKVDEEDIEDYSDALYETWVNLWEQGQFPEIVSQYLEKWRDRFYLFDEDHPFFQVRKEDIDKDKISKAKASSISGKNIDRTISESGNKIALFSPKTNKNKEVLRASEVARWLLTFQGYSGLSDKVIFGQEKYKSSKGWLFDIGGLYIKGNSLFETLMLNCILDYDEKDNLIHIQLPCWENSSSDLIDGYLYHNKMSNIASLYTIWSRGVYINPDIDLSSPFSFEIVKLPDINHQDNFLEPMSLWRYNQTGGNKDTYTPQKHSLNQSLWRSFGLLAIKDTASNLRKPGIIDWLKGIEKEIGNKNIIIYAVSMQEDGNATSWVPTDEITDYLSINELVLADLEEGGWVPRINDTVEETKKVISKTYKKYIDDIKEIRNISSNSFTSQKIEELYFKIDQPFRQWLASIQPNDEKDVKVMDWRKTLKNLVEDEAKTLLSNGGNRDYIGIVEGKSVKNIATAYNEFSYWLSQNLK